MQHTIRRLPPEVDQAIRRRARVERKSLNAVTVAAIARGLGLSGAKVVRRDLRDVVGSWKADPATESALRDQDRIDEDLWK